MSIFILDVEFYVIIKRKHSPLSPLSPSINQRTKQLINTFERFPSISEFLIPYF